MLIVVHSDVHNLHCQSTSYFLIGLNGALATIQLPRTMTIFQHLQSAQIVGRNKMTDTLVLVLVL